MGFVGQLKVVPKPFEGFLAGFLVLHSQLLVGLLKCLSFLELSK